MADSQLYSMLNLLQSMQQSDAVAGLADQKSARTGNVLGIAGVTFGLAATTADMSLAGASSAAFEQVGLLGGIGGAVGVALASKVGPTELPQTVAAFHSLGKCFSVCANIWLANASPLDVYSLTII